MESANTISEQAAVFMNSLPPDLRVADDPVERLLLREYGSMLVARGVVLPRRIIFNGPDDVDDFQSNLAVGTSVIGEYQMRLQEPAMTALAAAVREADLEGLSITPRGPDSGARDYEGTVELWASRVEPALDHWVANGRMTQADADRIRAMSPFEQVPEVLRLEQEGIYFAKDLSKSIIYSVAPPGASQHLAMLAFDVSEFADRRVRAILAKHLWYQTVVSDLPHFTYLGVEEDDLPPLGLRRAAAGEMVFWVPDI